MAKVLDFSLPVSYHRGMKKITMAEALKALASLGGKARAAKLSAERRREIAVLGGRARAAKRAAKGKAK